MNKRPPISEDPKESKDQPRSAAVMAIVEIVGFQVQTALTVYFQIKTAPTSNNWKLTG